MLTKDMRRSERRWRSHCVWMRRLKGDWDTHRGPWSPKLEWKDGVCSFTPGDRTELCDCYDVTSKQAIRFKDTPHPACSAYECDPRRALKSTEAVPIQELRAEEAREDWHIRKPNPEQIVNARQRCICGFLFGFIRVKVKDRHRWSIRNRDNRRCDDCKRRFGQSQELWPEEKLKMPA